MVPMTWDTNYLNQEGTKGCMTLIDRKNLQVFGIYAMEGINEIYPRPSEPAGISIIRTTDKNPMSLYRLNGQKVDSYYHAPGLYITKGNKFVKSW